MRDAFLEAIYSELYDKAVRILRKNECYLSRHSLREVYKVAKRTNFVADYIFNTSIHRVEFRSFLPSYISDFNCEEEMLAYIEYGDYDREESGHTLLNLALRNGFVRATKILVGDGIGNIDCVPSDMLSLNGGEGNIDMMRFLLDSVDPIMRENFARKAIGAAAKFGKLKLVKFLLPQTIELGAKTTDAATLCVRLASYRGQNKVVRFLLEQKNCDPASNNNYAVQVAAQNLHKKTLRSLLKRDFVDPSAEDDFAIQHACGNYGSSRGYSALYREDVVKTLMTCDQVNIEANFDSPLCSAILQKRSGVVELLLSEKKRRESGLRSSALEAIAKSESEEIVKMILESGLNTPPYGTFSRSPRIVRETVMDYYSRNRCDNLCALMKGARDLNRYDIVRRILERDDYDPSHTSNNDLQIAIHHKDNDLIHRILDHPKVRQSLGIKNIEYQNS